jgi:PAS domain S-box-containing protein
MSTSRLESERRSGSTNRHPIEHSRAFVDGLHLPINEANAAILNARLAAIAESSEDAIISKDLNGRIQTWNAGAERIFGYKSAEIVGNSITLLIPPERRTEEDKILEQIRRGERVPPFETVRLTKDGRKVDVSVTVSPIRDLQGRIVGASKIARNISDRKQAEREIAKAAEIADRAHRAKDDFLAILSHELRTPLTPVLVSVCDLLDDQRLPPDIRETLGMVHRNIELQVKLIDDLLDVTRITRGKLELIRRPLDLAKVFLDAVEVCKRGLSAKRQELIIERPFGPFPVMGDPTRLEQVFWNLLSNASKFTPEGGRIMDQDSLCLSN